MNYTANQTKLIEFIKQSSDLEVGVMIMDLVAKALDRLEEWDTYVDTWSPHSIIHPNYIKQMQVDRVEYLGTQLDKSKLRK